MLVEVNPAGADAIAGLVNGALVDLDDRLEAIISGAGGRDAH